MGTEQFAISGNVEPLEGGCLADRGIVQIKTIDIENGSGSGLGKSVLPQLELERAFFR